MNIAQILAIVEQLLTLVPQGTLLFTMLTSSQTGLKAIYAKGPDYVPTPDDWAGVDASVAADMGISDAQAAAARQALGLA